MSAFWGEERIAYLMLDSITRLVGEDTNLLVRSGGVFSILVR